MSRSTSVRLAEFLPRSTVNGPGERAVIWVQGCPFRCPGCWNQQLLSFDGPCTEVAVDEVWSMVAREHARSTLDGVTFSGGEPFAHAPPLAALARKAHRAGMSVAAFTGYTHLELAHSRNPHVQDLLKKTDLLIAGRYDRATRNPNPTDLRGSLNQEVLYLTGRIHPPALRLPTAEAHIGADGTVSITGFPGEAVREIMESLCQEEGR